MPKPKTYSFTAISLALSFGAGIGDYAFTGKEGKGTISVEMATEKTTQDLAADGGVMQSYIAGDNGTGSIEMQQTSDLHAFLLNAYNTLKTAADAGDPSEWASGSMSVRSLVDGAWHTLNGVSFGKVPPATYAAQGSKKTWPLMAADVQSGVN